MSFEPHHILVFKKSARSCAAFMMCCLLSSCASLPKSITTRSAVSELRVEQSYATEQPQEAQIIDGLLFVFQDETINELVQQALQHNLDIQLAAKQMEEAGFNASAQWGNIAPQFSGNMATNRMQGAQGKSEGAYSPSFDVSWEVDLWGKLRGQKDALDATALARAENYQAARDSIAAQVMQGWFDTVTAKKLVSLEEARLQNLQTNAQNSHRQYEAGLASLDDLAVVKRDIAQTRAVLIANTNDLHSAIRTLQVLLGYYPNLKIAQKYNMPALIAPPKANASADLLTNRPDLRAAWQDVLAADETVKVSHKEMYPSLNLTGSLGTQSSAFSDILSGATIWSLASNFSMPLFNAGQLKNNMFAAQSRAEQAWIAYLKSALIAFQEVEQALDREALLADQEREQQNAVSHAVNSARIFKERYKNGLVSILEYLTAQNTVFDMRAELLRIRNARLKNRVALALALGKGI